MESGICGVCGGVMGFANLKSKSPIFEKLFVPGGDFNHIGLRKLFPEPKVIGERREYHCGRCGAVMEETSKIIQGSTLPGERLEIVRNKPSRS